jgi:hypothetical protein
MNRIILATAVLLHYLSYCVSNMAANPTHVKNTALNNGSIL